MGFGLLGHVLEKRAGMDYESLVFSRICTPLGISDTRITLTPEMKTRLAVGHDPGLTRIDNWDFPALPGFGALRSTVNNLLILRSVNLGLAKTSITPIITATTVKKDHSSTQVSSETGLSWGSIKSNGREICFHSGGTGGYRTWIGFDSLTQSGTVVLSNTAWDVNDIALHILDSASPLSKPPSEHTAKQIDSRLFDAYTGNYLLGPDFVLSVSREGNRLYTRATGIGKYEILPESECDFFYKEMDMQISFIMGVNGKATELVLHQDLETAHLQRIV